MKTPHNCKECAAELTEREIEYFEDRCVECALDFNDYLLQMISEDYNRGELHEGNWTLH